MTISSENFRASYAGNGVTTAFTVPWKILDQGDVAIWLVDAAGAATLQTITTHYSVSNVGATNATVTMVTAPASGEHLVIVPDVPATQSTAYANGDTFPSASHERALDKLTLAISQARWEASRSVRFPAHEAGGVDGILPLATLRASRLMAFDVLGRATAGPLVTAIESGSAAAAAVDPADYGAVGDGVADDTAAVAAALSSGLPVDFGHGSYLITSQIALANIPVRMFGRGAKFIAGTDALAFIFSITDAPAVEVTGIEFDADAGGKGFVTLSGCGAPVVTGCSFHSFKDDPDTSGLYHALKLADCPGARVVNNRFWDLGQTFGGSGVQVAQYRAVTLNSGCDRAVVADNDFGSVFQPVVVAEYPRWLTGTAYVSGSRVLYDDGSTWARYLCIADHTSSGSNDPPDPTYWTLERADVAPTESVTISGNVMRDSRDNSIYALEYVKSVTITGNSFVRGNDEGIVIVCENATITGNLFLNIANKSISLELGTVDINGVTISGNTFVDDDSDFSSNFIVYRNASGTKKIGALTISGNTFRSPFSIGSASFVVLRLCDTLTITGNVFDVGAGAGESIIRMQDVVSRGVIAGNVFASADATAITVRNDSGGKVLIHGNLANGRALANTVSEIAQLALVLDTGSNIYMREPANRIVWGGAAPTVGAWTRGDWVLSTVPSAAGSPGWICTAGGSPGTWKAMASLAP